jgi:hypothetical protein
MKPDHEKSRPAFEALVESELNTTRRDSDGQYISAVADLEWKFWRAALDWAAEQAAKPNLAKYQPCGCVICTCANEDQCQGCGAKNCGTHPAGLIPDAVYEPAQDSAPAAPLVCCKCGEAHGLGHCLDFAKGPAQPTLDEATAPQPETEQAGNAEQRADEHFAGYNEAVEIAPRPRIETHTSNFLGIEWVRERDYIDLRTQLAASESRVERLRAELQNLIDANPKKWEDQADQFEPWVKSRARAALAETKEETTTPTK